MSGNDKNSNLYSASDIQKYLRGELSAPEMHQLEKAALEDPFLADALEGMEIYPELPSARNFQEDLDELQQRLDNRVASKDGASTLRLFRPAWRIAAVIILLLGLGVTAYFTLLNQVRRDKSVALLERKTPSASSSSTADSIVDSSAVTGAMPATDSLAAPPASSVSKPQQEMVKREETTSGTTTYSRKAAKAQKTGVPEEPAASKADDSRDLTISRAPANVLQAPRSGRLYDKEVSEMGRTDQAFRKQAKASSIPDSFKLQRDSVAFSRGLVALDKQPSRAPLGKMLENKQEGMKTSYFGGSSDQLIFTGKVTDLNNNALSGASLRLRGNYPASTVTDKYGNFSLKLPKKDSSFTLTVAYVGYEQASLDLSVENRTGNVIQLQPQASSLNEVVVSGYGAKRKEILQDNSEPKKEFFTRRAIPAEGWPAYNSYLETNKKTKNPDSTLKGNETISFIVNKEGILSSFKVEQSLSAAHDSAAIHLIQQGPSWKLLKGKKARAYVTIPF
jgi:hypothetical protein